MAQGRADGPEYAANEILIRWQAGAAKTAAKTHEHLKRKYLLLSETPLFPTEPRAAKVIGGDGSALAGWRLIRFGAEIDAALVARDYAAVAGVEYAEPNYLRRFTAAPNDSLWERQWNLTALGWNAARPEAVGTTVVGVVDSGLDLGHAELAGQLWVNQAEAQGQAGVDDDGNGYIDDINGWDFADAPGLPGQGDYLLRDPVPQDASGHGGHVGGIIAAAADNGVGIAGAAPGVQLMALRAGFNTPGGGYLEDDDIAAAVVYAVDNGADVINMSFGDPQESVLLRDVMRYAAAAGCVLVAAAGNEGNDRVFYPARYNETIGVAAIGKDGEVLGFSNRGPSIDVAAPGQGIWSLALGGQYVERSGTSMAAPHVAGLAAMLLARQPQWSAVQVRAALETTAIDIGPPGRDNRSGAGVVQVAALALENVAALSMEVALSSPTIESEATVVVRLEGNGIEHVEVSWGRGIEPVTWRALGTASVDGKDVLAFHWTTASLPAGRYVVRVLGHGVRGGIGIAVEDRVEVEIEKAAPVVLDWRVLKVLEGGHWRWVVDWTTDRSAGGKVILTGTEAFTLEAPPGRGRQRLVLPRDLIAGDYEFEIIPQDGVGVQGSFSETGQTVKAWSLDPLAQIPDGFLLPRLTDFNRNGLAEVVQMGYRGALYNRTDFFEIGADAQSVFSSDRLFIPWNVHDLDGDGKEELMAVDAQRVRLLEAELEGQFPAKVVWQQEEVWGGEQADLDGDGKQEMFLRSSRSEVFRVFESTGDDAFAETASLANPTSGENGLGQRQVIGDLDGDGRGDFLAGDSDGELFVWENISDDAYRTAWRQTDKRNLGDARVVGGGADLDGDGRREFIVARRFQSAFDLPGRFWTIEVYQAVGDDTYEKEWAVEVLGGKTSGNGISVGDLDGDGLPEWAVALPPNLYLMRSTGVNQYSPVWHAPATDTQRPVIGSLNGDADLVMAYNDAGVRLVRVAVTDAQLGVPTQVRAYPLNSTSVLLTWQVVTGAQGYTVFRDGVALPSIVEATRFEDGGLPTEQVAVYAVAAVDNAGLVGRVSAAVEVLVQAPPSILRVERQGQRHLAVVFDAALAMPAGESFRFTVEPGVGQPSSVIADRGGTRLLLGFAVNLPDSGRFELSLNGIKSAAGTPLTSKTEFALQGFRLPTRILSAQVLDHGRVLVRFSRPVVLPIDDPAAFVFEDSTVKIEAVTLRAPDAVVLHLGADGLRPLGRAFRLTVDHLEDENGQAVFGEVLLRFAPVTLGEVTVFPNPYYPARGALTFGGLPPDSRIMIFGLDGRLVRILAENDRDGGVQWDGLNAGGERVGSGVYLFKAVGPTRQRSGKFAVFWN